ncbi:kinase-like domain-containing protein [Xylaria sp. FL0064]|nr:kinase-like domain-containing protein [Xylaria sp. FL0064]
MLASSACVKQPHQSVLFVIYLLNTDLMVAPEFFQGSTSRFCHIKPGVILKYPVEVWKESGAYQKLTDEITNNFLVERQILDLLGEHPRIVKYLGWHDTMRGLLLAEASHGSLQRYLEENHDTIPTPVRRKWCRQVVESIAYIHGRGVIHSDLRPDNFLVHATTPKSLDLWLCDFGGSTCEKLGLDGKHLPDPGFFDPNSEWVSTPATDIFSVGSILYTILTGHWPYRAPGPFKTMEEMESYDQQVEDLFRQGIFPDVEELLEGKIILGC